MKVRMLMSDTEIIPRVKLEEIEYEVLKISKEAAEKVINEIAQQVIYMHTDMMVKKLKEDTDGKD